MNRIIADTSGLKLALQQAQELYVNPVVLGELLAGFVRS
jgi:hypothetical protein